MINIKPIKELELIMQLLIKKSIKNKPLKTKKAR
jgi:hypothetical protein